MVIVPFPLSLILFRSRLVVMHSQPNKGAIGKKHRANLLAVPLEEVTIEVGAVQPVPEVWSVDPGRKFMPQLEPLYPYGTARWVSSWMRCSRSS